MKERTAESSFFDLTGGTRISHATAVRPGPMVSRHRELFFLRDKFISSSHHEFIRESPAILDARPAYKRPETTAMKEKPFVEFVRNRGQSHQARR